MDYKEKLAKAAQLFEAAKAILTKDGTTAEESANAAKMFEEAKRLKLEGAQLAEIKVAGEELEAQVKADKEKSDVPSPSKFKAWGEFLYKTWEATAQGKRDSRLTYFKDEAPKQQKDLLESTGATGGFLVPAEFDANLRAVMGENSIARPRATIIPMRRRQVNIPVLDQTSTTAGIPHWFGGMRVYWTEEAQQKTETTPSFRQIELVAHKLAAITYASDELLDDSAISLEAFLSGPMGFGGAVAWMEDYAFLQGTGAGQPLGLLNAGATISVAAQAMVGFTMADVMNMLEHFLPGSNGVWMMNQQHLSNLYTLVSPGNDYVFIANANEKAPGTLFGYPVIFTEKLPLPGTAGSVVLADWKYYLVGDRQATTVEATRFNRFEYDETTWRCVHRVDGQPWLSTFLTLQDGSSSVSPFVQLGAKAT